MRETIARPLRIEKVLQPATCSYHPEGASGNDIDQLASNIAVFGWL